MNDEKNGLLAAVINASLDCVVVIDEAGIVIEWNPAAEQVFGYPRSEAIGREIADLIIPPQHKAAHAQGMARYLAGGAPRVLGRRVELSAMRRNGSEFPVELAITEVRTQGERLFTASLRDLSERERIERELSASKAELAAFLDHAPVGMLIKSLDGRYAYANRFAADLFGLEPARIVGSLPQDIIRGETGRAIAAIDREIAETGGEHVIEQHFDTVSGREVDALTVRFPLVDHTGAATRIGVVMLDMSGLRKAEHELEDSRRKLVQTEKISALGALLAGVSHELNNPLSVVVGEAYLLLEDADGSPLAERAERIRQAAERCSRIVQTFLAMARRKQPELVPTDIGEVVSEAIALTAYAVESGGVTLDVRMADADAIVRADRNLLQQVLVNLVVNAQQAMAGREGSVLTVSTALDGDHVIVSVADNGPGIPREIAERIFEPFYTSKAEGSGTGIGLSFSQGVIESHGGTLTLAPGTAGATFVIRLPIAQSD